MIHGSGGVDNLYREIIVDIDLTRFNKQPLSCLLFILHPGELNLNYWMSQESVSNYFHSCPSVMVVIERQLTRYRTQECGLQSRSMKKGTLELICPTNMPSWKEVLSKKNLRKKGSKP